MHYEVRYNDELCLYQAITATTSDPTICEITSDSLYVYVKYLNIKGSFTLTLTYGNLATKTLNITFE
ncbi:MAG: hypothetical protein IKA36_06345 [Clostridia bacterium]|nr:hypothetical protein [Clostridia bacterium]